MLKLCGSVNIFAGCLTFSKHSTPTRTSEMNESELFTLKENYANHIIDGMDMDSLVQLAYDMLLDTYKDCTEDEMIEEIKGLYDEETLIDLLPDAEVAQGS